MAFFPGEQLRTPALVWARGDFGASRRQVCSPGGGMLSGDTRLAGQPARITAWSPLRIGGYGFAAGKASFLKRISTSRSLTIEALIKVEINFCQRASRAHSVLFLQEPRSLARTESSDREGGALRKKRKRQSRLAMPGPTAAGTPAVSMLATLRAGARRQPAVQAGQRNGFRYARVSPGSLPKQGI